MIRGRPVVVAELMGWAAFASWGAIFRSRVLGWEAQRAVFFRFRGRLVVFNEIRGDTCILGAVFTWLGAQRAVFFRCRERLVVVAELRGGICILGRRLTRAEGTWMERQGSAGGIF